MSGKMAALQGEAHFFEESMNPMKVKEYLSRPKVSEQQERLCREKEASRQAPYPHPATLANHFHVTSQAFSYPLPSLCVGKRARARSSRIPKCGVSVTQASVLFRSLTGGRPFCFFHRLSHTRTLTNSRG